MTQNGILLSAETLCILSRAEISRVLRSSVICVVATFSLCAFGFAPGAAGTTIFFDDFDAGASSQWQEETGSWTDAGGHYTATEATVNYNSLPFDIADFAFDVDLENVRNGGVWLRSEFNGGLENGVLLVTGGRGGTGTGIYWHIVENGVTGAILNEVGGVFTPGVTDTHLRVEVLGDVYSAFLGGSLAPVTSLTSSLFASGRVALVNNNNISPQFFDNVLLTVPALNVPEPTTALLFSVGLLGIGFARKHQRQESACALFRTNRCRLSGWATFRDKGSPTDGSTHGR